MNRFDYRKNGNNGMIIDNTGDNIHKDQFVCQFIGSKNHSEGEKITKLLNIAAQLNDLPGNARLSDIKSLISQIPNI